MAREIGTYEISVGPEVCDVLGPDHPSTGAAIERVEKEEARFDLGRLVEQGVRTVRVVDTTSELPTN